MSSAPLPHRPPRGSQATSELAVPAGMTLDSWLAHLWLDGVQIDRLDALQVLRVHTRNSVYDIVVLAGPAGEVLVRGGRYFPEWTRALLLGCSFGRGLLKRFGVHVGMRLEFCCGRRSVVTSPVAAVCRGPAARPDTLPPHASAGAPPTLPRPDAPAP